MKENFGKSVYEIIWEPLLNSKFDTDKDKISMSWLWGKINLRSSSSKLLTECLGYMDGSFDVLTRKFIQFLKEQGCEIFLNYEVNEVVMKGKKYFINGKSYDKILSTVAYPITEKIYGDLIHKKEKLKMNKVKYIAAKIMVLIMNKKLTDFYWLNIGEKEMPFSCIIEHTNMFNSCKYKNKHIIYISNYMNRKNKLYNMSKEELLKEYEPYLKKISKDFTTNDIEEYFVFNEEYAQPIIEINYSKLLLPTKLDKFGLYIATMPQIYPEDRGMNYAIKLGYDVANSIIQE